MRKLIVMVMAVLMMGCITPMETEREMYTRTVKDRITGETWEDVTILHVGVGYVEFTDQWGSTHQMWSNVSITKQVRKN